MYIDANLRKKRGESRLFVVRIQGIGLPSHLIYWNTTFESKIGIAEDQLCHGGEEVVTVSKRRRVSPRVIHVHMCAASLTLRDEARPRRRGIREGNG
jgi:hypothetical protein